MRPAGIALASLLFACTPAEEDSGINTSGAGNGARDVPILPDSPPANGNAAAPPGQQPVNGQAAPEPSGEILFRAEPQRISQGGTVTLTLSNGTTQTLGYNLCTSGLQAASGEAVKTDRICTMELRTIQPGRSATYAYELPAELQDGTYRFVTNVERMESGASTSATGNAIEVR